MIHAGIDVSNTLHPQPSGVARYIRELVRALERCPGRVRLTLYCRPSRLRHGNPRSLFPALPIRWLTDLTPVRQVDVFHAPDLRLPRFATPPLVVTIHDLSALEREDHASRSFLERKRREYRAAATRARVIVTHTETIRNRIVSRFGLDPARVTAVPLSGGLPEDASPSAAPIDREGWLLAVGGPSRRKGSDRLPAFVRQWELTFGSPPEIRWVGSTPFRKTSAYFADLGLNGVIQALGHVDDRTLDGLYRSAAGLIVLSDTEGFGLPLLEAAIRGCPVLAVESETLVEVLGDAAFWLREPFAECRSVFRRFGEMAERREIVDQARGRAREFNWPRTAHETVACYERAIRGPGLRLD